MATTLTFLDSAFRPGKILCVGRNYVEHIHELGNEVPEQMVVFNKPSSSISETLFSKHNEEPLHFETELCFLIQSGKLRAVAIGMDLTKRQLQSKLKQKGLPWERAKAFDGSVCFTRFVEFDDVNDLSFSLEIDSKLQQQGDPSLMIYSPTVILKELSSYTHLDDFDVVMSGTPKGVGQVEPDHEFTVRLMEAGTCLLEHRWVSA